MKQIIATPQPIPSLDRSMIDEDTRKGWEYYAEHREKRPEQAHHESDQRPRASHRKNRAVGT